MALRESGEMYLETILVLRKENPFVRSVDVANSLGYSKPSVSRAINILKKEEYLTIDNGGGLLLTEKGKKVAEKVYYRHRVISKFLEELGVESETAHADACKMEHIISDDTLVAFEKYLTDNVDQ